MSGHVEHVSSSGVKATRHCARQIAENRLVDGVPEASLTGTHWAQHSTWVLKWADSEDSWTLTISLSAAGAGTTAKDLV
jgi:hypothetical protein